MVLGYWRYHACSILGSMASRIELPLDRPSISGPFSTVDAVANVGYETVETMGRSGSLFWADHSKQYYWAFQEIMPQHANNTPWYYNIPKAMDICSVQYGRVKISSYEHIHLVLDTFTKDVYAALDLGSAFDIAVGVVHFFPNLRVMPEIVNGRKVLLPRTTNTSAGLHPLSALEENGIWSGKVPTSNQRSITLTLADAVSILNGERPSGKLMGDIAMTYPQALVATYGVPIVCYDKTSTILAVAQSLSLLGLAQDIEPPETYRTFAESRNVGKYKIVSGWGYKMMADALPDTNMVAAIDLALAHSSSPEHVRAVTDAMALDVPSSDGADDLVPTLGYTFARVF